MELRWGKFLCLVEAQFEKGHEYFVSTYSSKPLTIHEVQHNFTEVEDKGADPLQKVVERNRRWREKRKREKKVGDQEDEG